MIGRAAVALPTIAHDAGDIDADHALRSRRNQPRSLVDVAHAQAPRCTSDAVALGDSESTVKARCGEPAEKRSYCAARLDIDRPGTTPQPSINTPCVNLDQWTYRSASRQSPTTLRFESGRLATIDDDRSATMPNQH